MQFTGFAAAEARAFAERWLPAWTGNDPVRLAGNVEAGRMAEAHARQRGVQRAAAFVALERERARARQIDQRFAGNGHLHLVVSLFV